MSKHLDRTQQKIYLLLKDEQPPKLDQKTGLLVEKGAIAKRAIFSVYRKMSKRSELGRVPVAQRIEHRPPTPGLRWFNSSQAYQKKALQKKCFFNWYRLDSRTIKDKRYSFPSPFLYISTISPHNPTNFYEIY